MRERIVVVGKEGISAAIIAHSLNAINNKPLVTFELENPRFVHAEFMTHRVFSRNAASSRAIPIEASISYILDNPAMPVYWGKNQAGMVAAGELEGDDLTKAKALWLKGRDLIIPIVREMAELGLHKQIPNRMLEPWVRIKVCMTTTQLDNFFYLRRDKNAQPEIRELGDVMWEALQKSQPRVLKPGEWHTPYYFDGYWSGIQDGARGVIDIHGHTLDEALRISASCTAQTSYRKSDETLEKANMVYDRLIESKPVHASPVEHQGTPMSRPTPKVHFNGDGTASESWQIELGTTHIDLLGNAWSGNFCSWIQARQLIQGHECTEYIPE